MKPKLTEFQRFAKITLARYERYLPTAFDESLTLLEKMNKLIEYLNAMGVLVNDVVDQWNEVMEWVVSDGINDVVLDRLDEMVDDGTLATIINEHIFEELNTKVDQKSDQVYVDDELGKKADNDDLLNVALPLKESNVIDMINYAKDNNLPISSNININVTDNIPGFHDVVKMGTGRITRDGYTFYITPQDTQTNTIYVSDDYNDSNDGITPDKSVSLKKAIEIIKSLGDKALDGVWSIKLLGHINQPGVRPGTLPAFKNRLLITGERDINGDITTIIDGQNVNDAYWWRSDTHGYAKFIEFSNLKFENWEKQNNAGAIVVWENIDVYVHHCEFFKCSRGVWLRAGRAQVDDCNFSEMWSALSLQYHVSFNVSRNTFINCSSSGCHQGRLSAGHFTENYFKGCHIGIDATQSSRLRTIRNTHEDWGDTAHNVGLNATHEIAAGEEDTIIEGSMSKDHMYQRLYYGGTAPRFTTGSHVGVHASSFPTSVVTLREPDEYNLGALLGGRILHIPKYTLLNDNVHIQITLVASMSGGANFDLVMTGESRPGLTDEYLRFPVTMGTAGHSGKIVIDIFSARKDHTTGYATIQYPHQDGVKSNYTQVQFGGKSATVDWSLDQIIHRLWVVKKDNANTISFVGYTTTIGVR